MKIFFMLIVLLLIYNDVIAMEKNLDQPSLGKNLQLSEQYDRGLLRINQWYNNVVEILKKEHEESREKWKTTFKPTEFIIPAIGDGIGELLGLYINQDGNNEHYISVLQEGMQHSSHAEEICHQTLILLTNDYQKKIAIRKITLTKSRPLLQLVHDYAINKPEMVEALKKAYNMYWDDNVDKAGIKQRENNIVLEDYEQANRNLLDIFPLYYKVNAEQAIERLNHLINKKIKYLLNNEKLWPIKTYMLLRFLACIQQYSLLSFDNHVREILTPSYLQPEFEKFFRLIASPIKQSRIDVFKVMTEYCTMTGGDKSFRECIQNAFKVLFAFDLDNLIGKGVYRCFYERCKEKKSVFGIQLLWKFLIEKEKDKKLFIDSLYDFFNLERSNNNASKAFKIIFNNVLTQVFETENIPSDQLGTFFMVANETELVDFMDADIYEKFKQIDTKIPS